MWQRYLLPAVSAASLAVLESSYLVRRTKVTRSFRAALCLWVFPLAQSLWPLPAVSEYPIPTAASRPAGIAPGADGNLWVTEGGANKIAKVTTGGAVTEYAIPTPDAAPHGIVAGPDGNLWFTESSANNIGKITISGDITEYPLPVPNAIPGQPVDANLGGITVGPDGNLWYAKSYIYAYVGQIGKITPAGTVTEFPVPGKPANIAAGPDGNLWFTDSASGTISKITVDGKLTRYPIIAILPSQQAYVGNAVISGPDGNLWFSTPGTVWSSSTAGKTTDYVIPGSKGDASAGIATGADGNLWFTEGRGSEIARLTSSGVITEFLLPTTAANPGSIISGPDGNLWFVETDANQIGMLVPSTVPPSNLLTLSTSSLTFNSYALGPNPPPQTLTISAPIATAFTATASVSSAGFSQYDGWLRITPSGSLTTDQVITVSVNQTNGLYDVAYTGNISLTVGNVTQTVHVTLNVTKPPVGGNISVSPTSLNFTYNTQTSPPPLQGGSVVSATQGVHFIPLTISVAIASPPGGNWLIIQTGGGNPISPPAQGSSDAGFRVLVDPTGLAPGTYQATVTFTPVDGLPVGLPVTLNVIASPTSISTNPSSLSFMYQVGGAQPAPQVFQVTESGAAEPFAIGVTGGSNWVQINPTTGAAPASIKIGVLTLGMDGGTYTETLAISLRSGVFTTVKVTLTIMNSVVIKSVSNAASFGTGAVAPGEIITIAGSGMGPSSPRGTTVTGGYVSNSVGGVSVKFGGFPAPILYVSDSQINCVVPYEVAGIVGSWPLIVTYSGVSTRFSVTLTSARPAIFTLDGSGRGSAAAANSTGGYNGPTNPAPRGSTITFYVTGEGQTTPISGTGLVTQVNPNAGGVLNLPLTPRPELPVLVSIGDQPATISFYGEAPGLVAGVMQVNAQVPNNVPIGDLPLVVSVGGVNSQSGVAISVR